MPLPITENRIPKEIAFSPLVDTTVEIRFNPTVHPASVLGILLEKFRGKYPQIEALPISNLPEAIRNSDPGLHYAPLYKLSNDQFIIQIGSKVLTVSCANGYTGWGPFLDIIHDAFKQVSDAGVAEEVSRIGLRYINFFANGLDIFEKVNNKVCGEKSYLIGNNSLIRTEINEGGFSHILQISNFGSRHNNEVEEKGSVIDIDISKTVGLENFFSSINDQATNLHDVAKKVFFGLLTQDFIDTLSPKYD